MKMKELQLVHKLTFWFQTILQLNNFNSGASLK